MPETSKKARPAVLSAAAAALAVVASALVPATTAAAEDPRDEDLQRKRQLAAEARAIVEECRRRFGNGYQTWVDHRRHVVYASALDARSTRYARGLIEDHLDAHRLGLFPLPLRWNVTVVLPTVADYYKNRAAAKAEASGYYNGATRTLTSISLSRVLLHELTHALHHHDQVLVHQRHAVWVSEGLASLYESAEVEAGRLVPQVGPDLVRVQEDVRQGRHRPLADLCGMDRAAFMEDNEANYAQARYVMVWLDGMGSLRHFYNAYKLGYGSDPTGIEALERVLERPIDEIEAAWRAWVLAQPEPWRPVYTLKAHLGIRMARHPEGVRVDGMLPWSAARRAERLEVGDVITAIGGRSTLTPRDLAAVVQGHRPGQTVVIEIVRDGRPTVVNQVLGAVRP